MAAGEYAFGDDDFERVRQLIYQRAGISLADSKRNMVYSRLVRRLRDTGAKDFAGYLAHLERAGEAEWQQFVNSLTTNLTSFFREAYHFPILAEFLRSMGRGRKIRIWCAAASTGEEPYSIAMTVIETLGDKPPVSLFASDIDTAVLARAEAGVYDLETAEGIGADRLRRFFLRGTGGNAGRVRARPELRSMIRFGQVNLIGDRWPFDEPFDVIFCRNVMIYFDRDTKVRIIERMHRSLAPEGLLFVGHSENFSAHRDLFLLRGQTVYRRVGKVAA